MYNLPQTDQAGWIVGKDIDTLIEVKSDQSLSNCLKMDKTGLKMSKTNKNPNIEENYFKFCKRLCKICSLNPKLISRIENKLTRFCIKIFYAFCA